MLRQMAARKEVVEELRTNPFGGYGLYHLMNDAGLLSSSAKEKLQPLIENVEHRLTLTDEQLEIRLPLEFEPMTDVEYDTLTYVIAEAIREFIKDMPLDNERLMLAELMGLNDTLERHIGQTSSLRREMRLEEVMVALLRACGKGVASSRYETLDVREGDYFQMRQSARSNKWFPNEYIRERRMNPGEIVRIDRVLRKGYLLVTRLSYKAKYRRSWHLSRPRFRLRKDNKKAVVYFREGAMHRIAFLFQEHVARFASLYMEHGKDFSYDPKRYQPFAQEE